MIAQRNNTLIHYTAAQNICSEYTGIVALGKVCALFGGERIVIVCEGGERSLKKIYKVYVCVVVCSCWGGCFQINLLSIVAGELSAVNGQR